MNHIKQGLVMMKTFHSKVPKKNIAQNKPELEYDTQVRIVNYLSERYPTLIVQGSLGGIRLPIGNAVKAKKMGNKKDFPDLTIAIPNKRYTGCFIELKREGTRLYKKNGQLVTNEHFHAQDELHKMLRAVGYYAEFAVGYQDAIQQIEKYLSTTDLLPIVDHDVHH